MYEESHTAKMKYILESFQIFLKIFFVIEITNFCKKENETSKQL